MDGSVVLYGLDYVMYYLYLLYYTFTGYPLIIRICVIVVTVCVIFYFILSLYLAYGVYSRKKERSNQAQIHQQYYEPMKAIALDRQLRTKEEIAKEFHHKKRRLKSSEYHNIIELLIEIKAELVDNMNKENFHNIATAFELPAFYDRVLQFGHTGEKIWMLKSIQSLNEYVSEAVLVRLLYHRKSRLRKAARVCYMGVSQNAPFRFFDEDKELTLSEWDMVELHNVFIFRKEAGFVLPNFMRWINQSADEGMKIFFINEIVHFNQIESCPSLMRLLNNPNIRVREEVIRALGNLKYTEAERQLVTSYNIQVETVKQAIVRTIVKMDTGNSLDFLCAAYDNAEDLTTKRVIIEGLYKYGKNGREIFNLFAANAKDFTAQLFAHVKDPLINRE